MESGARLNLTQLATLLEFGRRGTLTAAADALGYTPGAVSQHLAALERTVGTPLIRKTGRTRVLTDAGLVLLKHADDVLRAERAAIRAVTAVQHDVAGPLKVGTWGSTAAALLAPIVRNLAINFPKVSLHSQEVDLDDTIAAVLHGQVDVAFGLDYADAPLPRHPDITIVELLQETFSIAASSDTGGVHAPLEQAELNELPWILPPATSQYGRAILVGLRRRGVEPRVIHEVTDTAASLHLAADGLGATVITPLMRRLSPSLGLCVRSMTDPMTRDVVLLIPSADRPRPVTAFMETARLVVEMLPLTGQPA